MKKKREKRSKRKRRVKKQVQPERSRLPSRKLVGGLIAGGLVISLTIIFAYSHLFPPPAAFQFKAAIVDQLSIHPGWMNVTFVNNVTSILELKGFSVDYYPGSDVDVDFYRSLATHGYGVIVLRVHSTVRNNTELVDLFTSEPYDSTKYSGEQADGRISRAGFASGDERYFAVGPKFIGESMDGRFGNTIVVAMGCDSLSYPSMAAEFVTRGAKAYIGWNKPVTLDSTDRETIRFLKRFLLENKTLTSSVEGLWDPVCGSSVHYYPDTDETGGYRFTDIAGVQTPLHVATSLKENAWSTPMSAAAAPRVRRENANPSFRNACR